MCSPTAGKRGNYMAVTKIWDVEGWIGQVVNYVQNPDKTDSRVFSPTDLQGLLDVMDYVTQDYKTEKQYFVTGIHCSPAIAREQMIMIKQKYGKTDGKVAYHGYQSFKPGEVMPEVAHEIGVKLANELWGDRFQILVATHLDKDHLHNHFVINSVSYADGKKYNDCTRTYYQMREASDRLCREYGLTVIQDPQSGKSQPYAVWKAEKEGAETWYDYIREDIDSTISQSATLKQFLQKLTQRGYTVKTGGKYFAVRPKGKERFVRLKTLGQAYTKDAIIRHILDFHGKKNPQPTFLPILQKRYKLRPISSLHETKHLTSYQRCYFQWLYMMGLLPKNRIAPTYRTPEQRAALVKIDMYSRIAVLLTSKNIKTPTDLKEFEKSLHNEVICLRKERSKLSQYCRTLANPESLKMLDNKKNDITNRLRVIRKDLKCCGEILRLSIVIREKIYEQHENTQIGKKYERSREKGSSI